MNIFTTRSPFLNNNFINHSWTFRRVGYFETRK